MGTSYKPKYAVFIYENASKYTVQGWDGNGLTPEAYNCRKRNTLPKTQEEFERWIMAGVVSTYPGYVNEHIGFAFGIKIPSRVTIRVNHVSGATIMDWKAPMFQVLPDAADYPNVAKTTHTTE